MSQFIPIANFGLLSGIAIIMALVADLFLLPAILLLGRGRAGDEPTTPTV
jgi:predicted RND superfamily exporter protein